MQLFLESLNHVRPPVRPPPLRPPPPLPLSPVRRPGDTPGTHLWRRQSGGEGGGGREEEGVGSKGGGEVWFEGVGGGGVGRERGCLRGVKGGRRAGGEV